MEIQKSCKVKFHEIGTQEDYFLISVKNIDTNNTLPIISTKIRIDVREVFALVETTFEFCNVSDKEQLFSPEVQQQKNATFHSIKIQMEQDLKCQEEDDEFESCFNIPNRTITFDEPVILSPMERFKIVYSFIMKLGIESRTDFDVHIPNFYYIHEYQGHQVEAIIQKLDINYIKTKNGRFIAPYEINVDIHTTHGIRNVAAESGHEITAVVSEDRKSAVVSVKAEERDKCCNLCIIFTVEEPYNKLGLLTKNNKRHNEYYFYLLYNPLESFINLNMDNIKEIPQYLTDSTQVVYYYAFDRSTNMIGNNFDAAIDGLEVFLASLPNNSLFNIITLDEKPRVMFDTVQEVTQDNKAKAIDDIKQFSSNAGFCNLQRFFNFFDTQVLNNVDNEYAYNPHRIFIITNALAEISQFHHAEGFQDNDVQFICISLNSTVSPEIVNDFALKANGPVISTSDLTKLPVILSKLVAQTMRPYLYGCSISFETTSYADFVKNTLNNLSLTKIKELDRNFDLLTKVTISEEDVQNEVVMNITFNSIDGHMINEELHFPVTGKEVEYLTKFYDYNRAAMRREKETNLKKIKSNYHICDFSHCSDCIDRTKQNINFDIYLDDKFKFFMAFKESSTVSYLLNRISKSLGLPQDRLEFYMNGEYMNFEGTLKDNESQISKRIDVKKKIVDKDFEMDRVLLRRIKDDIWYIDMNLFEQLGGNKDIWAKIKERTLSTHGIENTQNELDDYLFTMFILNYFKTKFPDRDYEAIFVKAKMAIKRAIPSYKFEF